MFGELGQKVGSARLCISTTNNATTLKLSGILNQVVDDSVTKN